MKSTRKYTVAMIILAFLCQIVSAAFITKNVDAANDVWTAMDTEPLVQPGSAMDLSFLNDKPAGKYGFVKTNANGDYYFENNQTQSVRFYGPNLVSALMFPTRDQAPVLADRLASMGYNVVRLHFPDYMQTWAQGIFKKPTGSVNDPNFKVEIDPVKMDQLEYFISQLKARGIYVSLSIMCGFDMTGVTELAPYSTNFNSFKQFFLYTPEGMKVWKAAAKAWMEHVNPYTGLALKDDPVLVGVEPSNETHSLMNLPGSTMSATFNTMMLTRLNDYLTAHGVATVTTYPSNYWGASEQMRAMLTGFYSGYMMDVYTTSHDYLKNDLKIHAPVGGMNCYNGPMFNAWRTPLDVFETHSYTALIEGNGNNVLTIGQNYLPLSQAYSTTTTMPTDFYWNYYPTLSLDQEYGKPFVLSEFNHGFPASGRDEMGIILGSNAAFQGWDMLNEYRFAGINVTEGLENLVLGTGRGLSLVSDPLSIAASYQNGLLFRTGAVSQTRPQFVIVRDKTWALSDANAGNKAYGTENFMYAAHLFNTPTVFVEHLDTPVAVYKVTSSITDEQIRTGNLPMENRVTLDKTKTWKEMATLLISLVDDAGKRTAMLTALNNNQLLSDTGELLFDFGKHNYTVNTATEAAVAGTLSNQVFSLGKVSLTSDNDHGTLSVSSLDQKPVDQSTRLLMFHTTEVKGTDEVWGTSGSSKTYTPGKLPTLVQNAKGRMTLETSLNPSGYKAYKLAMNGTRLEEIPVTASGSKISVDLNTDKGLAFELVYAPGSGTDVTAPSAPSGLKAVSAPLTSRAYLTWTPSADATGISRYNIYNNGVLVGTSNGYFTDTSKIGAFNSMPYRDISNFTVSNLTPGTLCTFTVSAVDPSGNESVPSNSVNFRVPNVQLTDGFSDGIPDGWKSEYSSDSGCNGDIGIVSDENTNALSIYNRSWQGKVTGVFGSVISTGDPAWKDYTVSAELKADIWNSGYPRMGLVARATGSNYYLFCADNNAKTMNIFKVVNGTRTLLASTPATLSASVYHKFSFSLKGSSLQGTVDGQITVSATDTSYTGGITGIYSSNQKMFARNFAVKTSAYIPEEPTALTAVVKSSSSVALNWNAPSTQQDVSVYRIMRNGQMISEVPAGTTEYIDADIAKSTEYTYTVKTVDTNGQISADSGAALVMTWGSAILSSNSTVNPNDMLPVTVSFSSVTGVSAEDISVAYDKSRFNFVDAVAADGRVTLQSAVADPATGVVRVVAVQTGSANAISGNADVIRLNFKATAEGTATFQMKNARLSDGTGTLSDGGRQSLTVTVQSGSRAALTSLIADAQLLAGSVSEGTENGMVPAGCTGQLQNAIAAANAVVQNSTATESQILSGIESLRNAVDSFRSVIITSNTGDLNQTAGIDIGDIGIIAFNYGKVRTDSDWAAISAADLNKDGEIGLYELAFIAKRLISQ